MWQTIAKQLSLFSGSETLNKHREFLIMSIEKKITIKDCYNAFNNYYDKMLLSNRMMISPDKFPETIMYSACRKKYSREFNSGFKSTMGQGMASSKVFFTNFNNYLIIGDYLWDVAKHSFKNRKSSPSQPSQIPHKSS